MNNAGIYKIVNLVNNKIYVGSSVDLEVRRYHHFYDLEKNTHFNNYLQRSYNKNGILSFNFEVIEYVQGMGSLLEREQYWIDKLNTCDRKVGYNINPITNRPPSQKGKTLSEGHRRKISESCKGKSGLYNKGRVPTKEHRDKISNSNKKAVINLSTGMIFDSVTEAGKYYSIAGTNISRVCKGKLRKAGGFAWSYKK